MSPVACGQWVVFAAALPWLALQRWPARQVLTAVAAAMYLVMQSPMFV